MIRPARHLVAGADEMAYRPRPPRADRITAILADYEPCLQDAPAIPRQRYALRDWWRDLRNRRSREELAA
jgi:hypothetical protein